MFTYSSDRLTAGGRGGESTRTERRRLRSAASGHWGRDWCAASGTREADWYIRPRRCARACSWLSPGQRFSVSHASRVALMSRTIYLPDMLQNPAIIAKQRAPSESHGVVPSQRST
jgi:hypothetical protein